MQNKTILSIFNIFLLVALSSAAARGNVRRRQLNMGMGKHTGDFGWMDSPNKSDDPSEDLEACCEEYCEGMPFQEKFDCYGTCLDGGSCPTEGGRRGRQLNMGMGHGKKFGWMDGPNFSDDPSEELEACCEEGCEGLPFQEKFDCYGTCLDGGSCPTEGGRRGRQLNMGMGHGKKFGWMDGPNFSDDPSEELEACCEAQCENEASFQDKFVCYGDCLDTATCV